jgi:hypothetical protein
MIHRGDGRVRPRPLSGAALAGPLATVGKACLGRSALFELERPFY